MVGWGKKQLQVRKGRIARGSEEVRCLEWSSELRRGEIQEWFRTYIQYKDVQCSQLDTCR